MRKDVSMNSVGSGGFDFDNIGCGNIVKIKK